jgi:hypothetical protein
MNKFTVGPANNMNYIDYMDFGELFDGMYEILLPTACVFFRFLIANFVTFPTLIDFFHSFFRRILSGQS